MMRGRFLLSILLLISQEGHAFVPIRRSSCRSSVYSANEKRKIELSSGSSIPAPAFVSSSVQHRSLPTPEESAQALTDYMAKAHEEKLRAVREVEAKYKAEIEELKAQLEEFQGAKTAIAGGGDGQQISFEFPATNKALTEKVATYRKFMSDYIVKASMEKARAVRDAETKVKEKYEGIIASLEGEEKGFD